jgi:hypothetical protein
MSNASTSRGRFSNNQNKVQNADTSIGLTDTGVYAPASNTTIVHGSPTIVQAIDALDNYCQTLATKNYVDGLDSANDAALADLEKHIIQVSAAIPLATIDWDTAKHFTKTISGNTELFDSNLPVAPEFKEISLNITGNHTLTLPSYWQALSAETYDGTKANIINAFCESNTAVKQVDTVTLSGTVGYGNIGATGSLTKNVTFDTDLPTTTANFVTEYADDYLAEKVVITSDAANIIFTSSLAGYPFTSPTFTPEVGDLDGTVANTQVNVPAVKQKETITLSGADGKVVIATAGGLTKDCPFVTDLPGSVTNFVTTNADAYLAEGIVVTADTNDIVMEAAVAGTGFTAPTKTQVVGDLAGSVAHTHANVVAVAQVEQVVVSGTNGNAIVTGVGGLIKSLSFNSTLSQTVTDFKTENEAEYLSAGVVLTKINAAIQVDTITLTEGTGGTIDVLITGLTTQTITFTTDLAGTTEAFVDTGGAAAYYDSEGITITHSGADIVFTAKVAGTAFNHPTLANASTDLAGTIANTNANVTPKLIFTANTAGTAITPPVVTNDTGDMAGATTNTQINVVAEKQVETITLTGTDGKASVTLAGGLTKEVRFVTDLPAATIMFAGTHAADYLAQGIVVTNSGDDIIMTAQTAGTSFTAPEITNVPWDMDASITHTEANVVAVKQKDTVTLTGTGGDADISGAGGLTKRATFVTSLDQTATNFVNAYVSDYSAEGIIISANSADIVFEAVTAGTAFTNPVITNVAGDMLGSSNPITANVSPTVYYEIKQPYIIR